MLGTILRDNVRLHTHHRLRMAPILTAPEYPLDERVGLLLAQNPAPIRLVRNMVHLGVGEVGAPLLALVNGAGVVVEAGVVIAALVMFAMLIDAMLSVRSAAVHRIMGGGRRVRQIHGIRADGKLGRFVIVRRHIVRDLGNEVRIASGQMRRLGPGGGRIRFVGRRFGFDGVHFAGRCVRCVEMDFAAVFGCVWPHHAVWLGMLVGCGGGRCCRGLGSLPGAG